jgi:hypothetical protein
MSVRRGRAQRITTQIGSSNGRVGHDLSWIAIANFLSVVEHDQALANSHDLAQVVFNEHYGQTLLIDFGDGRCQRARFLRVQSSQWFILQQKTGFECKRAR